MNITIDAGHFKNYNIGCINGYYEGNMTWKLANYLKSELEDYGVKVYLTKQSCEADMALETRGNQANIHNSDLFISLHSDGLGEWKNNQMNWYSSAKGTTVFYSTFRPNSKLLADKLGQAVATFIGTNYRGSQLRYYGGTSQYKNADYYGVIRGAVGYSGEKPCKNAFLIEHAFHSNPTECTWLYNDNNLKMLAKREAQVIAEHFNLHKNDSIDYKALYNIQVTETNSLKDKLDKIKKIVNE